MAFFNIFEQFIKRLMLVKAKLGLTNMRIENYILQYLRIHLFPNARNLPAFLAYVCADTNFTIIMKLLSKTKLSFGRKLHQFVIVAVRYSVEAFKSIIF